MADAGRVRYSRNRGSARVDHGGKPMRPLSCLLLCLALAPSVAFAAAPKGAPPGYEAKYKEVLEAEKGEEYEKALTLLDQIPEGKQNVYTRLKRAGLLVRLGKFVEAEVILSVLVKDPAADALRATAQGDLDDIRARMPKLTVRMATSSPQDAWVTLDGKPIGPPVTVPLNPGAHLVVASRGGKEIFKQKITLQDSQALEVEIDTSVAPPAQPIANVSVPTPAPAPAPAPKPVDDPPSSGARRAVIPFVIGGVFTVVAVGSYFFMTSAQSSVEKNCAAQKGFGCDESAAGAGAVTAWRTTGFVSAGVALVAIGTGFILWGTADSGKKSAMATPLVGNGTYGLALQGRF